MTFCYIGSFRRLYDEEGIARSLEKLGHTVHRFEESEFTSNSIQRIRDHQPEVVLFAKLKIPEPLRQAVMNLPFKTVCWVPDIYFGLPRSQKVFNDVMFRADVVCTPDGGHDQEFKAAGVNHKLLRQGIFDEECYLGKPQPTHFKIIFVGTRSPHSPYRQKLMQRISHHYGNLFNWIGAHYTFTVRGKDLNNLYASMPIVVGDSFFSPHYWSNRIYETLGRGGFLIHPNVEGLESEFSYYEHFVPYEYDDYRGLFEKIDYFLSHDAERENIKREGFEYVKKHHTLLHRCRQLLSYL